MSATTDALLELQEMFYNPEVTQEQTIGFAECQFGKQTAERIGEAFILGVSPHELTEFLMTGLHPSRDRLREIL